MGRDTDTRIAVFVRFLILILRKEDVAKKNKNFFLHFRECQGVKEIIV